MRKEPRFRLGEIVYEPYAPLNPGKVVAINYFDEARFSGRPFYDVKWTKPPKRSLGHIVTGSEWYWELHLKSLETLIADHERKLAGHRKRLAKAQTL